MREIKNVVTWLKNWFYDKTEVYSKSETYTKTEVNTALGNKLNSNLTTANKNLVTNSSGDVILENKPDLSTKQDKLVSGTNIKTINNNSLLGSGNLSVITDISGKADKTGGVAQVTDANANNYTNIGSLSSGATQQTINNAINTKIGTLQSFNFIEITTTKPSVSVENMGKLFIVSETVDNKNVVNVYYIKRSGTSPNYTYSREKLDANILDELDLSWSNILDKPDSFIPSTHSSTATTYGVGTTLAYGHNKVIDSLDRQSFVEGESLSAHMGHILSERIDSFSFYNYYEAEELGELQTYSQLGTKSAFLIDAGFSWEEALGYFVSDKQDYSGIFSVFNNWLNEPAPYYEHFIFNEIIDKAQFLPKVINNLTSDDEYNSLSAKQGKVLYQAIQGKANSTHSHSTGEITDANAHSHISSNAGATQTTINNAIDMAIGKCVTSMVLVPKGSDPNADAYNGVIRLYYGDEPSS